MEMLNDLPCPVLITDRSGRISHINRDLLSLIGGGKAHWLGQPMESLFSIPSRMLLQTHVWPMLLHDGHLEEVKLEVTDLQTARSPVLVNCKRSQVEGVESFQWVLFVSRERSRFELALLEARNSAQASIKVIEERERALATLSAELIATQEKVRMANESGGVGIWDLDLLTGELQWDDLMYRLYGLQPSAQRNAYSLWASHLHPQDKLSAEAAFQQALASGTNFFSEFRVVWPDGSVHHLRGFGRLYKDASGAAVRIVGTNIDFTEAHLQAQDLKDARDKAESASQSKGQFLANMSHEIRTPMNAILGMLKLAQRTDLDAQQRDYVSKSESAAQSLLSLINDILDFSKIEAGKMSLESEPFQIEQLMRGLGVVLSANSGAKKIEVLFDVDPQLPQVLVGDAMRLQQVLINLGGNAVKFTANGQVTISLQKIDQRSDAVTVRFAVQDTGIGIAPEHQAHIFSDFSQAEGSTTRRFGGTGLGLSICRRIVNLMGSDLNVESALDQGSVFSFVLTLPLGQSEPTEPSTTEEPMALPRALVIDDNLVAGKLTLRMVQSLGWQAQWATSGAQALANITAALEASPRVFPYEAIYVDSVMPDMDGWETIRRINAIVHRDSLARPKIIMVTGGGRETLEQRTVDEQQLLNAFLVKPVTAGMLSEAYAQASTSQMGMRIAGKSRRGRRQLAGMRILLVEDNLINQQVADELLSMEGAIVSLAANGQLGVEAVATAAPQFDVVLMDIQTPVLDGYGATRAIRNDLGLRDLPIIAMTANAMASDRAACLAAGMNEHVGKPFDIAKLVSLLLRVTGLHSAGGAPSDGPQVPGNRPPLSEVPGLDLATALARMSGMHTLYVRTARDFSKVLDAMVFELHHCTDQGDRVGAQLRLHTLKGNAGTLGATDLMACASALEKQCKSDNWVEQLRLGFGELSTLCATTQGNLALAIAGIGATESELSGLAPASQIQSDPAVRVAALRELAALAKGSDLLVLQRYAELRENLSGLPEDFLEQMEQAIQNLELDALHALCIGRLD